MLTAVLYCLVPSELDALVASLRLDGFVCVATATDLDEMDRILRRHVDQPIVLFGPESLRVPVDDCPRLWLCCGPEVDRDLDEAAFLLRGPVHPQALERRRQALALAYQCVTFVDARCFLANAVAKQCVASMGVEGKAAKIVLRHFKASLG
jgi:hypothetical protein